MPIFLLRRSAEAVVTLLVLTIVIFALARLAGDPVPLVLGTEATKTDIEFYRNQYGLDKPLVLQYFTFLGNISHGDFGVSFRYRVPAIGLIMPALWATFKLVSIPKIRNAMKIETVSRMVRSGLRNRFFRTRSKSVMP